MTAEHGGGTCRRRRRPPARSHGCGGSRPDRPRRRESGPLLGCHAGSAHGGGAPVVKILELIVVLFLFGVAIAVVRLFVLLGAGGKGVPGAPRAPRSADRRHALPDATTIPRSNFHPGSGWTQLRLPEIYITLALVARLIARGGPTGSVCPPFSGWPSASGWQSASSKGSCTTTG